MTTQTASATSGIGEDRVAFSVSPLNPGDSNAFMYELKLILCMNQAIVFEEN